MDDKTIVTGVLMDQHTTVTLLKICSVCHVSEEALLDLLDHGLLKQNITQFDQLDQHALARIQSACRLWQDLDLNAPGVVLAMELLDELAQVREELMVLQRHVKGG